MQRAAQQCCLSLIETKFHNNWKRLALFLTLDATDDEVPLIMKQQCMRASTRMQCSRHLSYISSNSLPVCCMVLVPPMWHSNRYHDEWMTFAAYFVTHFPLRCCDCAHQTSAPRSVLSFVQGRLDLHPCFAEHRTRPST